MSFYVNFYDCYCLRYFKMIFVKYTIEDRVDVWKVDISFYIKLELMPLDKYCECKGLYVV